MKAIKLLLLASGVVFGGAALAAQQPHPAGDTSGPAVGTPVEPSTVIQKENPHVTGRAAQSEAAAGAPGMEAAPGTEAGRAPKDAPTKRD
jgi:hypothetical protein